MPTLNGAIPLAQVDDVAVFVGQDLKFDMMRTLDIFLDEDAAVAEGGQGLPRRDFHILAQLGIRADDPESASSAAGAGFDHDRVVGFFGKGQGLVDIGDAAFGSGDDRDADSFGELAGFDLAAHEVDGVRGGTDEGNAGGLAELGKFGVFREKSVSWMDGIGADALREIHDLLPVQEAFDGSRADEVGLVGFFDVDAGRIGFGIDGGCGDIQFAAAADDAHGDFAAIGDQNFLKHTQCLRLRAVARFCESCQAKKSA